MPSRCKDIVVSQLPPGVSLSVFRFLYRISLPLWECIPINEVRCRPPCHLSRTSVLQGQRCRGAATGGGRRQTFVVFTKFGEFLMLEDGLVVITGGAGDLGLACAPPLRERRLLVPHAQSNILGGVAAT